MSEQKWINDPKAEAVLASLNIKYTVGPLKLSDLNWKATEHNAGRAGRPIDMSRIDEYADAMMAGDEFPMPIVVNTDNGPEILAGVHRGKAAVVTDLWKTIPAYWANTKLPHEARMIACLTNRKEGARTTKEEAIEQALYIVNEFSLKASDVARIFLIPAQTLTDRIRADALRKEVVAIGFKGKLPYTTFKNLAGISGNTKVALAACEYIAKSHGTCDDALSLSKELRKIKTEAQQLAKVESMTESAVIHANASSESVIVLPLRTKFIRYLHSLGTVVGDSVSIKDMQIVPQSDEHNAIKKEWRAIRAKINRIIG